MEMKLANDLIRGNVVLSFFSPMPAWPYLSLLFSSKALLNFLNRTILILQNKSLEKNDRTDLTISRLFLRPLGKDRDFKKLPIINEMIYFLPNEELVGGVY